MNRISLTGASMGVELQQTPDTLDWANLFGLSGSTAETIPECRGVFYLDTDVGRFEGNNWDSIQLTSDAGSCCVSLQGGCFQVRLTLKTDPSTGILQWCTTLQNTDSQPHAVYCCMPRIPLRGNDYQFYAQYSGWCAENQGSWYDMHAGDLVLTNSAGRSCESCTPFACIRHKSTDRSVAIHVIPCGDWMIRFRHIAANRLSYTVLEAGLSDASLRLMVQPGEKLALPELLLYGFSGGVEHAAEPLQRYLLSRCGHEVLPELVYNSWFFDFDHFEIEQLNQQVQIAKALGCKTFVVDAGWFGQGLDWFEQVGNWVECKERAFRGQMKAFVDEVHRQGLGFGLWMEPERACADTPIYREHPEWFLPSASDCKLFDLRQEQVVTYLADQVTRLVKTYDLQWMKLDYNANLFRDLTGENYYRYYLGERRFLAEICRRNPGCSFQGCSAGGMRADFENIMTNFHGHDCSDTANPLETLRIVQNAAPRLLPSYLGSWCVLHETPFARGTYFDHDRANRTKVLFAGDGWWEQTVDVNLDFALTVNLLGQWGLSGELTSLSAESRAKISKAAAFYEDHRRFMAHALCHPLTELKPLDDHRGWAAMQYENTQGLGSLLYVFRLVDDSDTLLIYPKNLCPTQTYRILLGEESLGCRTGADLMTFGIECNCPKRYEACLYSLIPAEP